MFKQPNTLTLNNVENSGKLVTYNGGCLLKKKLQIRCVCDMILYTITQNLHFGLTLLSVDDPDSSMKVSRYLPIKGISGKLRERIN